MTDLNYETIKNQITEYIKEHSKIESLIQNSNEKQKILFNIFGSINTNELKDFYLIDLLNNINIILYKKIDRENNKEIDTILLIKEDRPVFQMEHYEKRNRGIICFEDTYSIYKENSTYLESRMVLKNLENNNFITSEITVLDSTDPVINDYYRKQYTFYETDEKVIALKSAHNMYLEGEIGFENRLILAIKLINRVYKKISRKLESTILEEGFKEYHVKRKSNV